MKNGGFDAISVNERHSMRHVDLESGASHIGKVPHFIEWMNESMNENFIQVSMFLAISYMGDTVK